MESNQIIDILRQITGPLGPLVSEEERWEAQRKFQLDSPPSRIPFLVEFLQEGDDELLKSFVDPEEARSLAAGALLNLYNSSPDKLRDTVERLALGSPSQIQLVENMEDIPGELVEPIVLRCLQMNPDKEQLIAIIGALSGMRTENSRKRLFELAEEYQRDTAVMSEINIALKASKPS